MQPLRNTNRGRHPKLTHGPVIYSLWEPEQTKPTPAKKDRKRWCGGHVGREHRWGEWYDAYPFLAALHLPTSWQRRCENCGREDSPNDAEVAKW